MDKASIKNILESRNLQTRLVQTNIKCELSIINKDNESAFFGEFTKPAMDPNILDDIEDLALQKALKLMLDKLNAIENLLKSPGLIALEKEASIAFLGHDILVLNEAILEPDARYYLRFGLFDVKIGTILCFVRALNEQILHVEKMQQDNKMKLDAFIADLERYNIKAEIK
ncbi:MAG: hypothetical protein E7K04_01580 [Helicobacter sp.]|nr:hypothetical protein [Helicobacter sp.]